MIVKKGILRACIDAWGPVAQVDMAIEEMAELTKALIKMRRTRGGTRVQRREDVREEIADVLMTVQQMRYLYGAKEVDAYIEMKTKRLIKRLAESENGN